MAEEKNVSQAQFSTKAQAELEQLALETARIQHQIAVAQLEAQRQQLEELQIRNEEVKQKRMIRDQKIKNARGSDKRMKLDRERKQEICNHSQGGEGLEGLLEGEGIQTTYQLEVSSLGEKCFRCLRCEDTVTQKDDPVNFDRIRRLPHKGLKGPVPIQFRFFDALGNQVNVNGEITAR